MLNSDLRNNVGMKKLKVAVGLSGGVDSSVAAYLLKKQGYDVIGVHMKCWDYNKAGCRGNIDRSDAIKISAFLNIPFVDLNFEKEYSKKVLRYFFSELKKGRTPNPDVMCNKEIKFGLFLDWAKKNKFDFVATGHYAQIKKEDEVYKLYSGADKSKDQSYFLYRLTQKELPYILFPVGVYKKTEIRKIAKEAGLKTYNKKDSTGICFVGDININDFIRENLKVEAGNVLDVDGNIIGEHEGHALYTVGQRHGFKTTKYTGLPLYVLSKNAKNNTITVGFGHKAQSNSFTVSELNWIPTSPVIKCQVRIRNLGEKLDCELSSKNMKIFDSKKVFVTLSDTALGVAPGQSAVFYLGDLVLGGGAITI